MHAGIKLIIGLILALIGLWLLVPAGAIPALKASTQTTFDWWGEFLTVLKGAIPPFLVVIGALVVWIESEELKAPEVPEIEEEFEEEEE
ncbi:MAG: hypothetical protein ACLFS3_02635 [Candidatus Aenigmatarchaeota archaeon]